MRCTTQSQSHANVRYHMPSFCRPILHPDAECDFSFRKSLYNALGINLWTFLLVPQLNKSSSCVISRNTSRLEVFHVARSCRPVGRRLFSFLESCTSVHKLCFSHNSWGFIWGAVGPIKDDPDPELFLWGAEVCSTARPENTHCILAMLYNAAL